MTLREITLYLLKLPLAKPYRVSYRVYEAFEPIVVEARDAEGRVGWGEGHISPGYSDETIEGGWAFCREQAEALVGLSTAAAKARLAPPVIARSPCAATALLTAVEMLEGHPLLAVAKEARIPLLEPVSSKTPEAVPDEAEALIAKGFRTLKLKVGFGVEHDLAMTRAVVRALDGRASVRLDANRAYSAEDGRRFASRVEPEGIDLFEQPCGSKDWAANAAVAEVSRVPVMLDESIYGLADIDRAAAIKGVGFVKLKLKKFGGLDYLKEGLDRIAAKGLGKVLGDGTSTEIGCWMEACVGRVTIANAGEFNGYLKPKARLFAEPLPFERGEVVLRAGYWPSLERDILAAHTVRSERFAPTLMTAGD